MGRILSLPIIAATSVLLMTACSDTANLSMDEITATIEENGFTCEAAKRLPKKAKQVGECRSTTDKYQKLIISKWHDRDDREQLFRHKVPSDCGRFHIKEAMRWSTSGDWFLVAGGNQGKDVKALKAVTQALGFEYQEAPCQ